MSSIMERLVGENVKLRRKLEVIADAPKHHRQTKDLLKLEQGKVERLTMKLAKMNEQVTRLKHQAKRSASELQRHQKLFAKLVGKNRQLEEQLRSVDVQAKSRKAHIRRIRESLKDLA